MDLSLDAMIETKMKHMLEVYNFSIDETIDGSYIISYTDFSTRNRICHICNDEESIFRIMNLKMRITLEP